MLLGGGINAFTQQIHKKHHSQIQKSDSRSNDGVDDFKVVFSPGLQWIWYLIEHDMQTQKDKKPKQIGRYSYSLCSLDA